MIRNPLQSALCRTRPDLQRVSEGIASSLRSFSFAASREAPEDDKRRPQNGRQRSAAAADALSSLKPSPFKKASEVVDARNLAARPRGGTTATGGEKKAPNVISVKSLPMRPATPSSSDSPFHRPAFNPMMAARGRGGSRGGASGARGRGRGRGGGGGRGSRGRRRDGGDGEGGGRRQRNDNYEAEVIPKSPEELQWLADKEQGVMQIYDPTITLESLAGWGPAIPSSTPVSTIDTAMRSMRVLGGGRPFQPDAPYEDPIASLKQSGDEGKFFKNLKEKEWVEEVTGEPVKGANEQIRSAIMNSAIQGNYDGPTFVERTGKNATIDTIRKYLKKQASYLDKDAAILESKVKSLLPAAAASSAKGKGAKATA